MEIKRFGIVSYNVITDPELSTNAKAIYAVLSVHCNKSRTCFPSNGTIADLLNVSHSTIKRGIKELKEFNYISRNGKYIKLIQ
tara:strand:+ start:372 stop:620 length:249 start_codon:yes stop_codon:yes gene_type:complete